MRLSTLDLAIILAYLAGITLFGIHFRKSQKNILDYFLGARNIPWWAICLSIVAAETSTLTIVGTPALAFLSNLGFLQLVLGYVLGRFLIAALFIPEYFKGDFITAYQWIERRLGSRVRSAATAIFLITRGLAEGVRVFAISLVVSVALGTGELTSIILISLVTLLYTFEGGMRAVIWTDVVQTAMYLGGGVVVLVTLLHGIPGGWPSIAAAAGSGGDKLRVFDFAFSLTRHYTFWSGLLGGLFLTMASHGTDQLIVQRLLAARSRRESQLALVVSGFVILAQFALFLVVGVMLYAHYRQLPSIAAGNPDRLLPGFVVSELPEGVAGLLIASILAAAMSNLSAALNSLASSSAVDVLRLTHSNRHTPGQTLRMARWLTILWGAVLIGLALMASRWGSVLEAGLTVASIPYGSLLGLFLLARLSAANERGALVGMAAGLAVVLYVKFCTPVAWTWYVLIGTAATFLAGYVASLLWRRKREESLP